MTTVGIAVAAVIPRVWQQAEDIGRIKSDIANSQISLAKLELGLSNVVTAMSGIDDKLTGGFSRLQNSVDGISARISNMDSDPLRYVVAAGAVAEGAYSILRVGTSNDLVIFPRTAEARAHLVATGLSEIPVAQGITAFPAPASWNLNFDPRPSQTPNE